MKVLTSLLAMILVSSCATILSGTTQNISVNSNAEGAEVLFNGQVLGRTPLVVQMERGQEGMLEVRKPGFQPYRAALNKKLNMMFLVNIFSGGTFGSSTDYSTGAMYEYQPGTYFASLAPANGSPGMSKKVMHKERTRAFVLMNNEILVREIAEGGGDHVDALLEMIPGDREARLVEWRAAFASAHTADDFAARLVAKL